MQNCNAMRRISILTVLVFVTKLMFGQSYTLKSPNGVLVANVDLKDRLTYSLSVNGSVIVEPSAIAMSTSVFTDKNFLGKHTALFDSTSRTVMPFWGTTASIDDNFNQLTLKYPDGLSLEFRCYNQGFAWRVVTTLEKDVIVYNESSEFNIPDGATIYFPQVSAFLTPFEVNYLPQKMHEIETGALGLTPLMYKAPQGQLVVLSEANLFEYPGMFIKKTKGKTLTSVFPQYPKKEKQELPGRLHLVKWPQISRMVVKKTENYIAKSNGNHTYPWRAIMVSQNDAEILENNLVYLLADEPKMDFSWVEPGKVIWDWYHNWNLQGVDFKPGINTQTYKHMIDFAAKNGIEYINIDDGWTKLWNFNKVNPNLNLEEVIAYAKSKGVKVFIWAMWNTIDKDFTANLDMFSKMEVSGLKVDFFDRADQRIVDFVNKLAEECAKRNLLLNLHGTYKPTGINRTFPNIVNIEGVLGLEYNKFSDKCTPTHNLTIPFVRNAVGPMDYTPGSMRHVTPENFKKSWENPHSMTTRAQQMAMYVVYHGGVQMLADSPTLYQKDSIALNFLSDVPVTWHKTIALEGKVDENVAVARKHGNKWYIGCMTATSGHDFYINLNFLDDREYKMTVISEGNSDDELVLNSMVTGKNGIHSFKVKPRSGLVIILE
ncbi:MAG TPA: glycoside hydrolase family 97 protein [Bacteroidales bacterium]|nr:glycoside hydrolase family 97 protein [Bacteroidales bacterium]